jgi:hypothetical protein
MECLLKMRKKRSKTSIASEACRWIQMYARLRDTDDNGWGNCCSCGAVVRWNECDGGHFQPKGRSYNGASIDPRNVHAQCKTCNLTLGGNPAGYQKYMHDHYTDEEIAELERMSHDTPSREVMAEALKKYKALAKELKRSKPM